MQGEPWPYRALLGLHIFLGLSALGGGAALLWDPSGELLGLHNHLALTPFPDYTIPGLILLLLFGVFALIAAWGIWQEAAWSWYAAGIIGIGHLVWLLVEASMIGFHWLQALYGLVALGIVTTAIHETTRTRLLEDAAVPASATKTRS